MNRIFAVLIVCCLAPAFLLAQNISHEEEVVRNAYAKLSFMCELVPVNEAAFDRNGNGSDGPKRSDQVALQTAIAKATPVFTLTDFRTGAIADIANEHWSQFVTWPERKSAVLDVTQVSMSYNYSGNVTAWVGAKVEWRPNTSSIPPGNPDYYNRLTVADAMRMKLPAWIDPWPTPPGLTFTHYAAYTVDVTFQGKSSGPHRAIFFFGHDADGKEVVAPNDMISGPGILYNIRDIPAYPGAFLSSDVRDVPVVSAWVRDQEMPTSACTTPKETLCCSHGRCGISQTDLNRDLAAPLPQSKVNGGQQ